MQLPGDSQGSLLAQAHALSGGCANDSLIPAYQSLLEMSFLGHCGNLEVPLMTLPWPILVSKLPLPTELSNLFVGQYMAVSYRTDCTVMPSI